MRFILCSLLLLVAAPAAAARVERARLADLTRGADMVVVGTAINRESYWQGGRILTRVRVHVEETWRGESPPDNEVTVVTLGGVVGTIGQKVAGEASIPAGSRVVLFLSRHPTGLRVLGLAQGLFFVADGDGDRFAVMRRLDGLELPPAEAADVMPERLDELRARVVELDHAP